MCRSFVSNFTSLAERRGGRLLGRDIQQNLSASSRKFGGLHGGYLMAIADSVGAFCASLNLPEGAGTSTIESKTNFLRPVTGGTVGIVAMPIHVGRTTIVVQTEVVRDDGRPVSLTIQTQIVLPGS